MAAIHVVPDGDQWSVKGEGDAAALSSHSTQQEAADEGRRVARERKVEFILHGGDGQIRERDSYGHDPRDVPG